MYVLGVVEWISTRSTLQRLERGKIPWEKYEFKLNYQSWKWDCSLERHCTSSASWTCTGNACCAPAVQPGLCRRCQSAHNAHSGSKDPGKAALQWRQAPLWKLWLSYILEDVENRLWEKKLFMDLENSSCTNTNFTFNTTCPWMFWSPLTGGQG